MQQALLITMIAASYLLFAGTPPWTRPVLLGMALVATLFAPKRTLRPRGALDFALMALLAAMVLQLLPLPAAVVSAVSPHAVDARRAMQYLTSAPLPPWTTLSIDRAATIGALATVALGVWSFWIARATFSGGGTRQFCRILGWLAAAFTILAIVQRSLYPGMVMGLVRPETRSANPFGPFTNRNHFAAWLLLASAPTIGYLIAHLHIHPAYRGHRAGAIKHFLASGAMFSAACALTSLGGMLMTLSRSAVAGLGAGAIAGGWLAKPRLRFERSRLPELLSAIGVILVLIVVFVDIEGWFTRLQQSLGFAGEGFDRMTIWRETAPIIRDFAITGSGAGTFADAMSQYQQTRFWVGSMQGWAFFNNAHSHYIQLAAEGGLLLTLPALAALALFSRLAFQTIRADKGEMFWIRIGAAAGLVGLMVQSIWEVSLTMPANAVLAGALAGLLLHHRHVHRTAASGREV